MNRNRGASLFRVIGFALVLALPGLSLSARPSMKAATASTDRWTTLARQVGNSEVDRASTIKKLRRIQNLSAELRRALGTPDRPLALDVINALDIQYLVPDLLSLVPTDPDGLLTLAVNAMTTEKNRRLVVDTYLQTLDAQALSKIANPTLVAMLEPLGRIDVPIPRPTLNAFKEHRSPDVRSALLYYLRIMALHHSRYEALDLVTALLRAPEYQVRLQAVSITSEIAARRPPARRLASLKTHEQLSEICARESIERARAACFSFLAVNGTVATR